MTTQLPSEIRDRIIEVANGLYEQNDRKSFPTVDSVRRAARADMNTTSLVMREWRRAQTATASPVVVDMPDEVTRAGTEALSALWRQAQDLANQSLRAAQAGWEAERQELDQMRAEISQAFEVQELELERIGNELDAALKQVQVDKQQHNLEVAAAEDRIDELKRGLASATERAERAEAQLDESEGKLKEASVNSQKRLEEIADLNKQLASSIEYKHELERQVESLNHQLNDQLKANERTEATLMNAAAEKTQLSQQLTVAQEGQKKAEQEASELRTEVGKLTGAVEAYTAILDKLKERPAKPKQTENKKPLQ